MARQKGSRNKRKANGSADCDSGSGRDATTDNPRAVAGDNSEMTDDQRHALTAQWATKLREAEKRVKDIRSDIKAELGSDGPKDVKLFIKLLSHEGEAAAKADMESRVRVMRWLGIPLGTQAELFPIVDVRPSSDVAYEAGKRYGLEGEPCCNPHDPSVPQYDAWMNGYQDGQAILIETKLRPMPAQPADDGYGESEQHSDDPEASAQRRRQEHAIDETIGAMAEEQSDGLQIPSEFRQ